MADVKISFERHIVTLAITSILPSRIVTEAIKQGAKYRRIAASISEVGIIEPLVVARTGDANDEYLLLDGHIRFEILLQRGDEEVSCLISDDDEGFTYNKRINRLATVQEHYMIVRALERGVPREKLARALGVSLDMLQRRSTLLDGISADVAELLKDKSVNPRTFDILRRMKPARQSEVAQVMLLAANFSASYASALLAATPQDKLAKSDRPKRVNGMTAEQMTRMEREMEGLQQQFKAAESAYGDDVLHLVIASGYLSKLLRNRKIEQYLNQYHPELVAEFRAIVSAVSLDHSGHEQHVA